MKKSKTVIMRWKPMPWMYFQTIGMIRKNEKWKKILCNFLLRFLHAIFMLFFIKECIQCLKRLENFFSANFKNLSFGRMKILRVVYITKSGSENKISLCKSRFGSRKAKIAQKYRSYWFWLEPLRMSSLKLIRKF